MLFNDNVNISASVCVIFLDMEMSRFEEKKPMTWIYRIFIKIMSLLYVVFH